MKTGWDNGLCILLLLGSLIGAGSLSAQTETPQGAQQDAAQQATQKKETIAGPNVVAVRLVKEDGSLLTLPPGIFVEVGKPLDGDQVAASLRVLYATGDYANLRAVTYPEADGVRLDFVVQENLYINQVIIEGLTPPPSESSAAAAMQLSLGQTYHKIDIDDAVTRLQDALREEGLYQAKISIEDRVNKDTRQIDIIAHVNSGPRVRLSRIELLNNTEYGDGYLLSRFKVKAGRELTIARVRSGEDRIRKFLEKKGHLSARVSVRRGDFNQAENTIPLALDVTEGPRVLVQVEGAKFSKGELKKLVPIYQEGSVDADLLEEGKRNLRERLEREGYFDANVNYSTAEGEIAGAKTGRKGSQQTITYQVDRGSRHKLLRIEFSGNYYFSSSLLRSRLTIVASSWAVRPKFSRRLLDNDAASMKSLYAANGFLSAKVEGKILDDFAGKTGDLVIRFVIDEGKQTLVSSLQIAGMRSISEEVIRSVVGSSPGQPFSDINVASDRDNILALYYNEGFPNATFSYTAETDTQANGETPAVKSSEEKEQNSKVSESPSRIPRAEPVKLVYKIEEGAQIRVKSVLLTGYNHTRRHIIQRDVTVKPDQPLREGEVVGSQQKLYNLGIFNRVTIEPQNANGTDPNKDVVVLVEEAKRYTIAYGGGFEVQRLASTTDPTGGELQAAPRGILEISKQNLTGHADSLSLKLRGSTIQGRALLVYASPDTFDDPKWSLQATAYVEKTQDINTFSQVRYEGNLQLTDQYSNRTTFLFRYAFRKVTVSNLNIPSDEIPLFNQPTLVSEFSGTWFRDTRDNPADATKGMLTSVNVGVASTAIGSSASFMRLFFQNSGYTPIKKNWNYARSIRVGILAPFADTVSLTFPAQTTTPPPQVIPLPERLFSGGGANLRGFALNQAGPRDSITGFPVGGQALVVINQELRFPLKVPFVPSGLGGAFFYDGGNSFSRLSRMTFRWAPPVPVFQAAYPGLPFSRFNPQHCVYNCTNELNYFSHTLGFGLRYATPVGPIRIDLGYQINRPLIVIPCKNAAVFCQQGTHLPHFQIFFNLGSSF
jgi:outer membrane protein assembly factor BamA